MKCPRCSEVYGEEECVRCFACSSAYHPECYQISPNIVDEVKLGHIWKCPNCRGLHKNVSSMFSVGESSVDAGSDKGSGEFRSFGNGHSDSPLVEAQMHQMERLTSAIVQLSKTIESLSNDVRSLSERLSK